MFAGNDGFVIPPGINTVNFDLFSCVSSACQAAYGSGAALLHPNPSCESSLASNSRSRSRWNLFSFSQSQCFRLVCFGLAMATGLRQSDV